MKYSLCFIFLLFSSRALTQQNHIAFNQVGFYTEGPKLAFLSSKTDAKTFALTDSASGYTVFSGTLGDEKLSRYSATSTRAADFSSFRKKGTYLLRIGVQTSAPFHISDSVLKPVALSSLKGFYYQRVSEPLDKRFAGQWARSAGHPDTSVLIHPSAALGTRPAGTRISSPGGWYDAGDYNKYIVNSGITMGTLLSAYEDFPSYFDRLHTNIPESSNEVPDILDEIIVNLRWMLTMQDPNDGGVYHKCTNAAFDGMVMPGVTQAPRYVVQKSTAASLDFAAVAAQASRVLKKFGKQLPGLSDSCLVAAERAWSWSLKNPDVRYDQTRINEVYQPQISTGAYGDREFKDEQYWAACELLVTTGEKSYIKHVSEHVLEEIRLPSWSNVEALGVYTLLRNTRKLPSVLQPEALRLKKLLIKKADLYLETGKDNAFRTVMGQSKQDFNWGSNANAANQGILLLNAYSLSHSKAYLSGALGNLDYLLGRNATGYCFVTGLGSKRVMHPHHRPSAADGMKEPVPGLLSGGPNYGMQDAKDGCTYPLTDPETAFVDDEHSYASNEIAINWNAPLVYLANAVEALSSSLR